MTSRPALVWGVRASFREYLASLDDARIELDGALEHPLGFLFPPAEDGGFAGAVVFRAHDGALDVTLARPALERGADGTALRVVTGAGRLTVARLLDAPDALALADAPGESADVALTLEGAQWLGGVYRPWTRMDPVLLVTVEAPS